MQPPSTPTAPPALPVRRGDAPWPLVPGEGRLRWTAWGRSEVDDLLAWDARQTPSPVRVPVDHVAFGRPDGDLVLLQLKHCDRTRGPAAPRAAGAGRALPARDRYQGHWCRRDGRYIYDTRRAYLQVPHPTLRLSAEAVRPLTVGCQTAHAQPPPASSGRLGPPPTEPGPSTPAAAGHRVPRRGPRHRRADHDQRRARWLHRRARQGPAPSACGNPVA